MVNIVIDDMIQIKKDELEYNIQRSLFNKLTFYSYDYFNNREKKELFVEDDNCIYIPANINFIIDFFNKNDISYKIEDKRVAYQLEMPKCNFQPKTSPIDQALAIKMIQKHNYDCMLTLPTGGGKNAISIYLASYLNTSCLYIASKVAHLENFKNEIAKHIDNFEEHTQTINSNWLKSDGKIKAYNLITTRSLLNLNIANRLKDKVGLIIADEIHKHITAEKTREGLYTLNAKYRLFLSATPETKIKGLTSAALSVNKVHIDDKLEFNINFQKIVLTTQSNLILETCYDEYTHISVKKSCIYNDGIFLDGIVEFVSSKVNREHKGVMIHNDSKEFHSTLHDMLSKKSISSAIINSDTKKENIKDIFKDFEDKKIDVLISGAAMEEAVSLYRLSCIISTCITVNSNMLIQLLGRLKRYDTTVCDKQKEFIFLTYDFIAAYNYTKNIEPNIEKLSFINKLEDKQNKTSLCITKAD